MRKNLSLSASAIGGVLIAVLGVTVGVAASASSSEGKSTDAKFERFQVVAKPGARYVNDIGNPGPSLGDYITFTNTLYRGDVKVGYDGGVCTTTAMQPERVVTCLISMSLPDGLITATLMKPEKFPPEIPAKPFRTAITGGTGAYADARGDILLEMDDKGTHYVTVNLVKH